MNERKDVFVVMRFGLTEKSYVAGVFTTMEEALAKRTEWTLKDGAEATLEPFQLNVPREM